MAEVEDRGRWGGRTMGFSLSVSRPLGRSHLLCWSPFPSSPSPGVAARAAESSWQWLVETGGGDGEGRDDPEEGAGSCPLQRLLHLVSDGTLGTGEPVCPSIKVAASE